MSHTETVDARAAKNMTEKPFAPPYSAFTQPRGRIRRRRQRLIPAQAAPPAARKGDSMKSEAKLAWALADAVSVCFTTKDQLGIYTALGAGETYGAIDRMLDIAVRKRYPLPAKLISALAAWLDCYIGNEHEPTTRSLLNQVEPQALPTTSPPLMARGTARSWNPSISIGEPDRNGTRHVAPDGAR
jgi:hypothetical protein